MVDALTKQYSGDPSYLRAALLLSRIREEKGFSSVLLTSASQGEGVSTTTYHLAEALQSQHGLRPVVIEMSTSNTGLAKSFGFDSSKSIQNVLNGTSSIQDAIQSGPHGIPVLASSTNASTSIIDPERLTQVIRQLEGEYDLVLVDGPSILDDPEGLAVANLVPRIILVVRSGFVRHEVLDRLRRELENHHVEIVGMLLNAQKRVIPRWIYRLLAR